MINPIRFAALRWERAHVNDAQRHQVSVSNPVCRKGLAIPTRTQQDLRTLKAMCDGRLAPNIGMLRVAHSGGWPIPTRNGYLVATPAHGARTVAVASDASDWQGVPLERRGEFFVGEIRDNCPRYKLVIDGTFRADPWARQYTWDNFGEMSLAGARGRHMERWPQLTDGTIAPRDVWVWVPSETPRYQLTFLDGQNAFEPRPTDAWPGSWRIQDKVGAHTLVVGVDMGDRMHANSHTQDSVTLPDGQTATVGGGAEAQSDFLARFLSPCMQRQYGKPQKRLLLGSSMTGLGALHAALVRHPGTFDAVIAMSPTLGWGRIGLANPTLREVCESNAAFSAGRTHVVLFSGGNEHAKAVVGNDNFHQTRDFHEFLAARGVSAARLHSPGGQHGEHLWQRSVRACLDEAARNLGIVI